jgi:hypothetical protein
MIRLRRIQSVQKESVQKEAANVAEDQEQHHGIDARDQADPPASGADRVSLTSGRTIGNSSRHLLVTYGVSLSNGDLVTSTRSICWRQA